MIHCPSVLRRPWPLLTIVTLAACARATPSRAAGESLAEGSTVMGRCQTSEQLVIENQTGYPLRVTAVTDLGPNRPMPGSAVLLMTIATGAVDTISTVQADLHNLVFDVERANDMTGLRPPIRGIHARCVRRA